MLQVVMTYVAVNFGNVARGRWAMEPALMERRAFDAFSKVAVAYLVLAVGSIIGINLWDVNN
jgi:hypothetical protein